MAERFRFLRITGEESSPSSLDSFPFPKYT
nr:MAG TPA: Polyphosphate kinase N-terminal domain [Caudoviricetes sp.]DAV60270.1 MAG TPA: Polyphosphate kinase N-terminal domain [Caudoviricetes sp.]DAX00707.1 MAG TPA: Polyphosphate kinase N-terminal domain [Bacteriophage sp.]